jgi:hypothetical protein
MGSKNALGCVSEADEGSLASNMYDLVSRDLELQPGSHHYCDVITTSTLQYF